MALEFMDPAKMTDAGMYLWAGIVAVLALGASWLVALWWQKRRDARAR